MSDISIIFLRESKNVTILFHGAIIILCRFNRSDIYICAETDFNLCDFILSAL